MSDKKDILNWAADEFLEIVDDTAQTSAEQEKAKKPGFFDRIGNMFKPKPKPTVEAEPEGPLSDEQLLMKIKEIHRGQSNEDVLKGIKGDSVSAGWSTVVITGLLSVGLAGVLNLAANQDFPKMDAPETMAMTSFEATAELADDGLSLEHKPVRAQSFGL